MSDTTNDMPARVAVLEQIARDTHDTLTGIRTDMREMRTEMLAGFTGIRGEMLAGFTGIRGEMLAGFTGIRGEIAAIRAEARSDYRWLLGLLLGGFAATIGGFTAMLGVMAHGFHWI